MKSSKATILATIIILSSVILAISSFWNDSLIVDEIPHVGSGYAYVKTLDYRLNPEHPPLAKALAALPLLFLNLKQNAFQTKFWLQNINGQWDFGRSLIFQSGNDAELITKTVKFPILIFFILSALLVYKWTKKLYGRLAALTALALFSFSPTVLAHSRFVTTDVPALFGIILATFFFIKFLENPDRKNLWLSGIAFGIAMLTKFSTFLLIPYLLALVPIFSLTKSERKNRGSSIPQSGIGTLRLLISTILIFATGFVLIVWPVYFLFTFNYPPERQLADTQFLLGSFGNRTLAGIVEWMADKPIIRALGQYGLGLLMVSQRASGGNTAYFLGEVSAEGRWYYFPFVYLMKEPLTWLILMAISLFYLARQFKFKKIPSWVKDHFIEFAMLLWLAVYWTTSIKSNLNIGVRHLLPTYPFAIILVSGQIAKLWQMAKSDSDSAPGLRRGGTFDEQWRIAHKKLRPSAICFMLFALLGWYVAENLRVWPYYITYFNQFAGGPSGGYRYVVDSNLDWGQDLKRLSQWVEKNNVEKIHLDYFGWSDPVYYLGPKFIWLTAGQYKSANDFIQKTGGGYLAVSTNFYMNSRQNPATSYSWLDQFKPVAVIGNSIWVWELR